MARAHCLPGRVKRSCRNGSTRNPSLFHSPWPPCKSEVESDKILGTGRRGADCRIIIARDRASLSQRLSIAFVEWSLLCANSVGAGQNAAWVLGPREKLTPAA